jgi:hypothetical protein
VWSACNATQIVTLNSWQVDSLRLQSQPGPVSSNSNCDPALFEIPGNLGSPNAALDGGPIALLDGGGITLVYGAGEGGAYVSGCDAGPPALKVTPGDASLQIAQVATPPSPNTVSFTATATGCVVDASVSPLWSVDQPGIASISEGGVLTLAFPYAGPIHVTAYGGGLSNTAVVNVTVNTVDTSGVPEGGDAGGIANAFLNICGADAGGGG